MELVEMIIIVLQITSIAAKKKHKFRAQSDPLKNSGESIENLLYYKDCKHKKDQGLMAANTEPPKPACPCPRMCCSMCCDCSAPQPFIGRQMAPLQLGADTMLEPIQVAPQPQRRPPPQSPVQPQIMRVAKRNKKLPKAAGEKPPDELAQPPIGSRRNFAFTRDNVKSLIAHDQDIKKILKDLVRVTMHKVDLVEQVNVRRNTMSRSTTKPPDSRSREDDYGDL